MSISSDDFIERMIDNSLRRFSIMSYQNADVSAAPDSPQATTMAPAYLMAANIASLLLGQ